MHVVNNSTSKLCGFKLELSGLFSLSSTIQLFIKVHFLLLSIISRTVKSTKRLFTHLETIKNVDFLRLHLHKCIFGTKKTFDETELLTVK